MVEMCFFEIYGDHRDLHVLTHAFPTRRSSELGESGAVTEDGLLRARLAADMLPLGRQIQIACDNAKNGPARLAGHNAPRFGDDEKRLAQYRDRVENTIAYIRSFTPRDFDGSEVRMIDQAFRGANYAMPGGDYVRDILLPNFHFHIAIAHALLRHDGLSIGKRDYLGNLPRSEEHTSELQSLMRISYAVFCLKQ